MPAKTKGAKRSKGKTKATRGKASTKKTKRKST